MSLYSTVLDTNLASKLSFGTALITVHIFFNGNLLWLHLPVVFK